MRFERAFFNCLKESIHFLRFPAALQLDPPVLEISDPSDNIEATSELLHGIPEADTLNASFIKYLASLHGSRNKAGVSHFFTFILIILRPACRVRLDERETRVGPRFAPRKMCATVGAIRGFSSRMKVLLFAALALASTVAAVEVPQPFGKANARTFPYSMIGQLLFDNGRRSYLGSGTVIRPRSVLTAGHNVYDPRTGWSTDVEFRRSNYGENDYLSRQFARRLYVLGGYRSATTYYGAESVAAFAKDAGGLVFRSQVADGGYAGWVADASLLLGSTYNILLGYGAESHSGEELLYVEPTVSFYRTYGSFLENDSIYIEGGMSGGPAFAQMDDNELYVAGIVVSSSGNVESGNTTGGIRSLTRQTSTFIRTYLR